MLAGAVLQMGLWRSGSALDWQSRGQGFESPQIHHNDGVGRVGCCARHRLPSLAIRVVPRRNPSSLPSAGEGSFFGAKMQDWYRNLFGPDYARWTGTRTLWLKRRASSGRWIRAPRIVSWTSVAAMAAMPSRWRRMAWVWPGWISPRPCYSELRRRALRWRPRRLGAGRCMRPAVRRELWPIFRSR